MGKRSLVFGSMLMVVGIAVLANLPGISAEITDCGGDLESILMSCVFYIAKKGPKTPPSQDCCGSLKNIDVPCFCQKYVNPFTELLISAEKAIYVVRTCGHSVSAGFKCGNYTAPPVSAPVPEK